MLSTPCTSSIAKSAGTLILRSGGVVRGLTNWGPFLLPNKVRVHQATHNRGHYFIMQFDSSGRAQSELRRVLGLDPRMIRFSVVRVGKTLEEIAQVRGTAPWPVRPRDSLGTGFADSVKASSSGSRGF